MSACSEAGDTPASIGSPSTKGRPLCRPVAPVPLCLCALCPTPGPGPAPRSPVASAVALRAAAKRWSATAPRSDNEGALACSARRCTRQCAVWRSIGATAGCRVQRKIGRCAAATAAAGSTAAAVAAVAAAAASRSCTCRAHLPSPALPAAPDLPPPPPQFGKYLVEKQRPEWADQYVGARAAVTALATAPSGHALGWVPPPPR